MAALKGSPGRDCGRDSRASPPDHQEDETIKVFIPDYDVDSIRPKKAYQHVRLFGQGELQRLVLGALREGGHPMSVPEVAATISRKLGREPHPSMASRVRCNLIYLRRHKACVQKIGEGVEVRWTIAQPTTLSED